MVAVRNPLMVQSGGNGKVTNGILKSYLASGIDIPANTLVVLVSGKVSIATRGKINGITRTACTTTEPGKVWVYDDN